MAYYLGMEFVDFRDHNIILSEETEEKIKDQHPEISMDQISKTLLDPTEVRASRHKNWSELYYSCALKRGRYICVVVKFKTSDGKNYIETAYTSMKIKSGEVIFSKIGKEEQ